MKVYNRKSETESEKRNKSLKMVSGVWGFMQTLNVSRSRKGEENIIKNINLRDI